MGSGAPLAFNPSSVVPLWLNGKEVISDKTFPVNAPYSGDVLWQASAASSEHVDAAIGSAREAFKTWRWSKPKQRRDLFLRAYEVLKARRDLAFEYSHAETEQQPPDFDFDFGLACELCLSLAGLCGGGKTGTLLNPDGEGAGAMVVQEPYGVVLGIAPWNAPFILGMRTSLAPIAAGNTVILKGPELAPATFWFFVSALHEAGMPPGVLNTIYHDPADAVAIIGQVIAHPAVKKVAFTGSDAVGSSIGALCGKHLKPYILELGGKGAAIVCEDADLAKAASTSLCGAFLSAGQVCMSTERIIVVEKVANAFKEELKTAYDSQFSKQHAALASEKAASKPRRLVEDALSRGATLLHGELSGEKNRMRPVVLEGVTSEMRIFREETFGPAVSLYVVRDEEAAVELANGSEYGLTAAVFSRDVHRAVGVARRLEAGAVHINGMTVHDEVNLPHGGWKRSGTGRFNSDIGLGEWVQSKSITWRD